MFNNWLSLKELIYFFRKVRRDPRLLNQLVTRLGLDSTGRVEAMWNQVESPPTNWWNIPAVQRRKNRLISGEAEVDHYAYVSRKYLTQRLPLRALSLGCGSGASELRWAELNAFESLEACDLAPNRIRYAAETARQKGLGNVIHYRVANVHQVPMPEDSYDLIYVEQSLHHFAALDNLLARINRALKPDGYFVVDEFVGPARFQWTARQIEAMNALLAIFPRAYKILWDSSFTRLPVFRPSRLGMVIMDPSEAIESDRIVTSLQRHLDVIELKPYGGALLHILFSGIAHHFLLPDATGQRLLDICFNVEDALLACGEIDSDFVVAVCKKRVLGLG